ncbi:peptidoglycan-binding protein [Erythrobacter oryzae]|uniref:CIS tube protein n=1 Tax=Erythrobacter oryzae TaxID=3019556 RepID=UPI00255411E0|nr:peptidoglycan-binding protein [Erythrobacter sp. COR-2]
MTDAALVKAKLIELEEDLVTEKAGFVPVPVQFNPETFKVTYANEVKQPEGGDQAAGTSGMQFVGAGTTKLALTLWFDVTAMTEEPVDDVRRLTSKVIYFMTPRASQRDASKLVPPGLRFVWGSFIFDGMVEGLEESLEFFSPDGKPLRAQITLTVGQQKILVSEFRTPNSAGPRAGQRPFTPAPQGKSLQDMAAADGKGGDWQAIASANRIEDPLRIKPGTPIDLNLGTGASARIGAGTSFGAGAPAAPALSAPDFTIAPPRLGIS